MMKRLVTFLSLSAFVLAAPAFAHFGMLIPSQATVSKGSPRTTEMQISFSHPFEMVGMDMAKPKAYGVVMGGSREDLLGTLKPVTVMDKAGWSSPYTFKKPGVYIFYVDPEPYWEPAEDAFIVHHTKVVVPAFGLEEGWDKAVGRKIEIIPVTRPFGLYAGNVFQGVVRLNGKPLPHAEVEIEFYNRERLEAPNEYLVTQAVKADRNGVFTYAAPAAGWWGFAALTTADYKLKKEGNDKPVEIGGVIWVYFHEWPRRK